MYSARRLGRRLSSLPVSSEPLSSAPGFGSISRSTICLSFAPFRTRVNPFPMRPAPATRASLPTPPGRPITTAAAPHGAAAIIARDRTVVLFPVLQPQREEHADREQDREAGQ